MGERQLELGDVLLDQELNEFPYLFLVHREDATASASKRDQLFGRGRQHLAPTLGYADHVFNPDAALTGMATGSSVTIQLSAPSSALLSKATLKLNGADVSSSMHTDGAGSMSGVVDGLQPGAGVPITPPGKR